MTGVSSMTDGVDQNPGAPVTAGALLKRARQAQGLHIAALSASIKVAQRKLESLEADRFDELPDATFTRALAQTVCRSLKIDSAPVLALLPPAAGNRLGDKGDINAPFRERPGRGEPQDWSRLAASPAVWGPALLLLGAVVVYFLPADLLTRVQRIGSDAVALPAPAASAVSAAPASSAVESAPATAPLAAASASVASDVGTAASAPLASAPATAPADASVALPSTPAATTGPLELRATAESWIEVQDATAKLLISRKVLAGETVQLDGAMPLKVKIGNAAGTNLVFRGQPVSLAPYTRDNVARLELK